MYQRQSRLSASKQRWSPFSLYSANGQNSPKEGERNKGKALVLADGSTRGDHGADLLALDVVFR